MLLDLCTARDLESGCGILRAATAVHCQQVYRRDWCPSGEAWHAVQEDDAERGDVPAQDLVG